MPRHLLVPALLSAAAILAGCQSSAPTTQASGKNCDMPECNMAECQAECKAECTTAQCAVATTQPAGRAAPAPLPLPSQTIGSILDRSGWEKSSVEVPAAVVPHFSVLIRDFETPVQKDARRADDPAESTEQRIEHAMGQADAGNWNKANLKDGFAAPIKFMYDIGVLWVNLPLDLSHGVPQTPDPVSDKIRREKCEFYP